MLFSLKIYYDGSLEKWIRHDKSYSKKHQDFISSNLHKPAINKRDEHNKFEKSVVRI